MAFLLFFVDHISLQSYEWKDGQKISNADLTCPLYAAYFHAVPFEFASFPSHHLLSFLETSIRRDACQTFNEREAATNGANKRILLDHFFGEIAFKIGRAPKYGA